MIDEMRLFKSFLIPQAIQTDHLIMLLIHEIKIIHVHAQPKEMIGFSQT